MCDFGPDPANIEPPGVMTGPLAVKPEIWKNRHAVVITARFGIATVVPISTSVPKKVEPCHVLLEAGRYPFLSAEEDS
jgi:mRNA-degrading endonuclease toxin of MazEF toxin-antitoxin module